MTPNDTWGSCLGDTTTQSWSSFAVRSRKERSTSNPQRYQFSQCTSHSPVLSAYEALPVEHQKTSLNTPPPRSLAWPPPIAPEVWRRLWTIQSPNLQKSRQLAGVLFWWLHSLTKWEEFPGGPSLRKRASTGLLHWNLILHCFFKRPWKPEFSLFGKWTDF